MNVFSDALQLARSPDKKLRALLKQDASWRDVFTRVNSALLVAFLIYLFGSLVVEGLRLTEPDLLGYLLVRSYGEVFNLVLVVAASNLALLLISGVYYSVSRLVGGKKNSFRCQTFLLSRVFSAGALGFACALFLNDVCNIISYFTGAYSNFFSITVGLAVFALVLYAVYRTIALVHSFELVKALVVFFLPFFLLYFLFFSLSWLYLAYFAQQGLRVTVVGEPSENLEEWLGSEMFELSGIDYRPLSSEKIQVDGVEVDHGMIIAGVPGMLDSFDVVIVSGAERCNRNVLDELKRYLDEGGKMILVGNACTRVPEMEGVGWNVWDNGFDDYVPVRFVGTHEIESKFQIFDINHPAFNGVTNFDFAGTIAVVELKDEEHHSRLLAFFSETDSYSVDAKPAIVEHRCVWINENTCRAFGPAYYVAFDLGLTSREMLQNILLSLKE